MNKFFAWWKMGARPVGIKSCSTELPNLKIVVRNVFYDCEEIHSFIYGNIHKYCKAILDDFWPSPCEFHLELILLWLFKETSKQLTKSKARNGNKLRNKMRSTRRLHDTKYKIPSLFVIGHQLFIKSISNKQQNAYW